MSVRAADPSYADTLVSKYQVQIQILQEKVRNLPASPDPKESRDLLNEIKALANEKLSFVEAWALYQVKRELCYKTYGLRFFWLREICDCLHTFVLRIMQWAASFFKRHFPTKAQKSKRIPSETQTLGAFRGGVHSRLYDKSIPTRLCCVLSGLQELWKRLENGQVLKQSEAGKFIDGIIEDGISKSKGLNLEQIAQQLIPDKQMEKELKGLPLQRQIQRLSNRRGLTGALWSIPERGNTLFILFDGRKSPGVFYFGFLESEYPPSIRVASNYQAIWNVLKKQLRKGEQFILAPVLIRSTAHN